MSSGKRTTWQTARQVADSLLLYLDDVMMWHCIAGSVRREKTMVGDIEIVVRPTQLVSLLNRLDVLVNAGTIAKAAYGKDMRPRWGQKYRGLMYLEHQVEIFICDENNQGYLQWLRTGEAQKNTYVMTRLKACRAAVRFSDGYGWHVSYDRSRKNYDDAKGYAKSGKLIISDEFTMYSLLGMKPVVPQYRNEKTYRIHLDGWVNCPSSETLQAMSVPELTQRSMF